MSQQSVIIKSMNEERERRKKKEERMKEWKNEWVCECGRQARDRQRGEHR